MLRIQLVLYDCSLCAQMKSLLREVSRAYPVDLDEVDINRDPDLREQFDQEVPVLFIEGRKAFKYRTIEPELRNRLDRALLSKENISDQPLS